MYWFRPLQVSLPAIFMLMTAQMIAGPAAQPKAGAADFTDSILLGQALGELRSVAEGDTSSSLRVEARLLRPNYRVTTSDPYHKDTFRASQPPGTGSRFSAARYKARLDLQVLLLDPSGVEIASKRFTGRASHRVRYPPPHAYRTRASIHAIGRTHVGCSHYADEAHLLRRALHDALSGDEGALAWTRQQTQAPTRP